MPGRRVRAKAVVRVHLGLPAVCARLVRPLLEVHHPIACVCTHVRPSHPAPARLVWAGTCGPAAVLLRKPGHAPATTASSETQAGPPSLTTSAETSRMATLKSLRQARVRRRQQELAAVRTGCALAEVLQQEVVGAGRWLGACPCQSQSEGCERQRLRHAPQPQRWPGLTVGKAASAGCDCQAAERRRIKWQTGPALGPGCKLTPPGLHCQCCVRSAAPAANSREGLTLPLTAQVSLGSQHLCWQALRRTPASSHRPRGRCAHGQRICSALAAMAAVGLSLALSAGCDVTPPTSACCDAWSG